VISQARYQLAVSLLGNILLLVVNDSRHKRPG